MRASWRVFVALFLLTIVLGGPVRRRVGGRVRGRQGLRRGSVTTMKPASGEIYEEGGRGGGYVVGRESEEIGSRGEY